MTLTLTGRITRDPKVFSPQGSDQTKLTISIANNDKRYLDKRTNEWKTVTVFVEVDYWTKSPTSWINRIVKGAPISVDIKDLFLDEWENERGKGVTLRATALGAPQIFGKAERSQPQQSQAHDDAFDEDVPF